jgi:hypothetical protein
MKKPSPRKKPAPKTPAPRKKAAAKAAPPPGGRGQRPRRSSSLLPRSSFPDAPTYYDYLDWRLAFP